SGWMSFSRHPRSPSMGIYSAAARSNGVAHAAIPHSHSSDVTMSSWPHPSPSTLDYGRISIANRGFPIPNRGARVMREEMEFERLTYGGGEENGESNREYIQETDILGDDSSSGGEEGRRRGGGLSGGGGERREQRSNTREEDDWSSEEEIDDPEYRDLMEREQIVEKYDKGPEAASDDNWENPNFELYNKLDRYGFVHKEGEEAEDREVNRRRIEREVRREKKWLEMIREWEYKERERRERERKGQKVTRPTQPAKLFERIWKGVPEKLRGIVWPRLLRVDQYRKEKVYEHLLLRARLVSKDIRQIDLDINRTYRDHLAFRKRYDVKQQSLLNVLSAYSMFNTEVGYCQGMSQIVALFLMYLDEEESFWCLHALMVNGHHTMHGFFVPGFPKLSRFENHFKRILKKYKPKIYKHLDKEGIPYIYLTKWWFGCFLDRVPFSLTLRLWDLFLVEGDSVLLAMALNVFKMHEKRIRKFNVETFMEFVQSTITKDFGFSDDEVMYSLRETMDKLKSDRLLHAPAPSPSDLPEVPTKALGPVLTRSMADIRSDIAEIQSRCSRANSTATGRSPHPRKKRNSMNAHSSSTAATPSSATKLPPPSPRSRGESIREEPHETPRRRASPPPLDPRDGIIAANRRSVYDNLAPSVSSDSNGRGVNSESVRRLRDEQTGHVVSIVRDRSDLEDYRNHPAPGTDRYASEAYRNQSTGIDRYASEEYRSGDVRVTQLANHITYVTIGDDEEYSKV
ncbi:hypothetical protein PFISCL1PPCAC_8192, partial [Pristionchus fissidentatus]